jgi:hypothetical protein
LRLALLNLLDNPIRYSPAGTPITMSVNSQGGAIAIDVIDRGPGIPVRHPVAGRTVGLDLATAESTNFDALSTSLATAGDLEKQELELTKISRVSTRREACHTKGSRPSDSYQRAFAAGS